MIPKRITEAVLVIMLIALAVVSLYSKFAALNFLETMTFAQVVFSVLMLLFVIYTLYAALTQLRKSMAKPRIKVAFNEKGEQQATLTYKDGKPSGLPALWLINEGNAISRYFQIDFIIPENIGKPSVSNFLLIPYVSFVKDDGEYILSYTNDGRYTLFVNRPYRDPNMIFSAAIDASKCIEVYKGSFKIEYRIYGDWAETQKETLKVYIKQQEAT
jgi:hypothetical protein